MNTYKKLVVVLPLIFLLLPALALANSAPINSNVWNINILKGPLVTCTGTGSAGPPQLPACSSLCDFLSTVANVVYFMIGVVIWILTPLFVAWAGILFIISAGSTERTSQARKMIRGIVIGLLIVLCAYLIVATFVSVLGLGGAIGGFGSSSCQLK